MKTKNKTFDCVEMKRRAQEEIQAEYEAHKDEYESYGDYLRKSLAKTEWGRRQLALFDKNR
jgi:hypothetical protein